MSSMDSYITISRPCSTSSQDTMISDEYSDVSSLVSSNEISIFNEDTDEETEETAINSLEPYQFEPIDATASDSSQLTEDESSSDEEQFSKLPNDMSWCHCGNCKMMPTRKECICCCSIVEMVAKLEEVGATCITESEGFNAVCLNQWVLETAYYQYRQQYGKYKESIHEQY
ncbi:uncharacterized protein [Dysidea avara]|uniref:uncharacterized protein n=1 Tax=Dysidea avara TaxID=196820 RepID=UPI0033188164